MTRSQSYKFLVFGTGAVGAYFGGKLALSGFDVTFISRGKTLEVLKAKGLTFIHEDNVFTFPVCAVDVQTALNDGRRYDVIFICVKSGDTTVAADICKKLLNAGGTVVSMQNGTANLGILQNVFSPDASVGCVINSGVTMIKPGAVEFRSGAHLTFGGTTKKSADKAGYLQNLFSAAGVSAVLSGNINYDIWKKLVWNIAFNPLSALLNATCGALLENPDTYILMRSMAEETAAVAESLGISITKDDIDKALAPNPIYKTYKTSALQDVYMDRKPEIEGIMGPVVHSGLDVPVSQTVYRLCRYKFDRWFHVFPSLAADVLVINGDMVLLIDRKFPPFGWAIPGGMLDYGEKIETTAVRELEEETGITVHESELTLVGIYSDPKRDSRGHTVSAVYFVRGDYKAMAADDAKDARYFHLDSLPNLAFDHGKVISDYIMKFHNL